MTDVNKHYARFSWMSPGDPVSISVEYADGHVSFNEDTIKAIRKITDNEWLISLNKHGKHVGDIVLNAEEMDQETVLIHKDRLTSVYLIAR